VILTFRAKLVVTTLIAMRLNPVPASYAVSKGNSVHPMRQRVLALLPTASGKTMAAYEIAGKLSDTRKVYRRSTASQ
jgi:hypothetical protein